MIITLDIETIGAQSAEVREDLAKAIKPPGNYKKPETIAEWERNEKPQLIDEAVRKTSLDGLYGQIVVIGLAIDDEPARSLYSVAWASAEASLLIQLNDALEAVLKPGDTAQFVGHNLVGFDLKFLRQRYVINSVRPHWAIPFKAKPWEEAAFDTMVQWAGPGGLIGLAKLCKAFGIAAKGLDGEDIDGSKVGDYVLRGEIAKVAKYCESDVERTREVFRRMTFAA